MISLINIEIIKVVNIFRECTTIHSMEGKNIFCIGSGNKLFAYNKINYKYYDNIFTEKCDNYHYNKVIGINKDMYLTIFKDGYAYSVNIYRF